LIRESARAFRKSERAALGVLIAVYAFVTPRSNDICPHFVWKGCLVPNLLWLSIAGKSTGTLIGYNDVGILELYALVFMFGGAPET